MTTTGGRLEGTRQEILNILRRRGGGVSVDELARELRLTGATVRRHLDVLLRDDYVSVSQARGRTGRPRYLFSLTEGGEELFPHHYVRLTHRLLEEIVALDSGETAGRAGAEIANLVFQKMSDRIAHEYAPQVVGETLEERSRSAVALIREEGIDFEVEADLDAGEVRLYGRGCPCTRLGEQFGADQACDHDRRMLEQVLHAPVALLPSEAIPHDFLCGYVVYGGAGQAPATVPGEEAVRP
jgi:DeoR family suf operon transcriptional repressor